MKLSEFVLTHKKGSSPVSWEYFADVTVETGFFWWKKTERKKIHRKYAGYWHFIDTGKHTPGVQAEDLERAYNARVTLASL